MVEAMSFSTTAAACQKVMKLSATVVATTTFVVVDPAGDLIDVGDVMRISHPKRSRDVRRGATWTPGAALVLATTIACGHQLRSSIRSVTLREPFDWHRGRCRPELP